MRIGGFDVPFRFLPKPEVWVLTLDVDDSRAEGLSNGGWPIKAYPTEDAAKREKRLAENLVIGCTTFLIQNSDKSVPIRNQLLEREQVWIDLVELLPKGFGPEGLLKSSNRIPPIFGIERIDVQ